MSSLNFLHVSSKLDVLNNFMPVPGVNVQGPVVRGLAVEILDPVAEVQETLTEDRGQEEEEVPAAVLEQRQAVVPVLVEAVGEDKERKMLPTDKSWVFLKCGLR